MAGKRWISGLVGIGMLSCFVAGCDDGEGDALTPEEAAAIAKMIGGATVGPLLGQSLGSLPPDGRAMTAKEYDFDVPCSEGGSVNLSGTADSDFGEDDKSVEIEGTISFDHCAEKMEDGETITLTEGSIDQLLHVLFSSSVGTARVKVDGSWSGSVAWENEDDGSSGVCEVDVTLDATIEIDMETKSYDVEGGVTGTVCGILVDADADDWVKMGKGGS